MNKPERPAYRNSGISWIGTIPAHWEVHRIKWTVKDCSNGVWGGDPDGVDDVVCVRVADFDREALRVAIDSPTLRAVDSNQLASRKLQRGDLLIEKSGGGDKQLVGCVVQFDQNADAVCSNFVARMPIEDGHSARYWCYAHAGLYAGRLNYPAIKQTTGIQNLDAAAYLNTLVAYPPLQEQQKIAEFLDWKTGQIDALIAKKRELIDKLKEKRLAVITQSITEGIAHWEERRLRFIAAINPSSSYKLGALGENEEVSFIPMDAVGVDGGLNLAETRQISEVGSGYTQFQDGDVVVAKITPCFENGKAALADGLHNGVALGTTELHVIRSAGEVEPKFLFYLLTSHVFRQLGESEMYGAGGQKRVPPDFIKNYRMALPSMSEQRDIVCFLDDATREIDAVVDVVTEVIRRLIEYRSSLIASATTGQLEVRRVASPQPT